MLQARAPVSGIGSGSNATHVLHAGKYASTWLLATRVWLASIRPPIINICPSDVTADAA